MSLHFYKIRVLCIKYLRASLLKSMKHERNSIDFNLLSGLPMPRSDRINQNVSYGFFTENNSEVSYLRQA